MKGKIGFDQLFKPRTKPMATPLERITSITKTGLSTVGRVRIVERK